MTKVTEEMVEAGYNPCGGCGAIHPKDRCIGCWHDFTALSAPAEPVGVGVKELEEAYAKGFEASGQGYNGEIHIEYDQDNEWLADRSIAIQTILSALSLPCKENGETVTPSSETAMQAGPLMKRSTVDGVDVILPSDTTIAEEPPTDASEEELQAWLADQLEKPMGGTW